MEFTWKKLLVICGIFVGLIVLPVWLCSNPMMESYQKRIDRNPNTNFSKWLQMASADVCYKTMRPEMAVDYYRRFYERYKEDPRRPKALLYYAKSLDECNRNADAIKAFEEYIRLYPDREDKKEAVAGIDRIKYMKPK
jgi:tetratricopeptide (TPR) repeat protein